MTTSRVADGHRAKVVAIIVTYNSADVITRCIEALVASAAQVDLRRVLVVDNNSIDDTRDLAARAHPLCDVLNTGANLGYAAAINHGLSHISTYDALLVLNADTELQPGAVAALARALEDPSIGIAVPQMLTETGEHSPSLRRWPSVGTALAEAALGGKLAQRVGLAEVVDPPARRSEARDVEWATGAALAISSAAVRRLGPWDESFFLYSEETEYMMRSWRSGLRVRYVPQAQCLHRGGESGVSPQLWALLMFNKVQLFKRTHGWATGALFHLVLLVGQIGRACTGSARARAASRVLLEGPPIRGQGAGARTP